MRVLSASWFSSTKKVFTFILDAFITSTCNHDLGSGLKRKRKCKVDKSLNVLTDSFMLPSSSAETPSTHSADSWKHVTHWFPVLSARFTLRIILHLNFGNSCWHFSHLYIPLPWSITFLLQLSVGQAYTDRRKIKVDSMQCW